MVRSSSFLLGALLVGAATQTHAAERISLDPDWHFKSGDFASALEGKPVNGWFFKDAPGGAAEAIPTGDFSTWKPATFGGNEIGSRVGFAWFVTNIDAAASLANSTLLFSGVDDNATVYVNGQKLASHEGWDEPFEVPTGAAWKVGQPNTIAVLVENTAGRGGIDAVSLRSGIPVGPDEVRPGYNDASWRRLGVPHDFVVENDFDPKGDAGHGFRIKSVGIYRKTFNLSVADLNKSLSIDFQGVFRNSTVWLNGEKLGSWKDGYAPFSYEINKFAKVGVNTLAVRADGRASEGWWYEGGGIYRDVTLIKASPLHVAKDGMFVSTSFPEPVNGASPVNATVKIQTELANDSGKPSDVWVVSRLIDPSGKEVAGIYSSAPVSVPLAGATHTQSMVVRRPTLWTLEKPALYRIETKILSGKTVIDSTSTPFGFRTERFDAAKGFMLNGVPVKIKGTCNHQDFAGVGVAVTNSIFDWRVRKLKEMGSNAYRTSHNPVANGLLEACDRQGMLVMDETRNLGDATGAKSNETTPYAQLTNLKAMVKRDRNHPSIILWSMANEEGLQSTAYGAKIFAAMKKVTDDLDGTRPVSAAMNGGHTPEGFHSVQDVEGFNYDIGSYDRFHATYPNFPMYGSETSSAVATRGEYVNDPVKGYTTNFDHAGGGWAQRTQDAWKAIATRPFVAGGFVWTGFDYRGEPTPYGWPCINSHFGVMDMCGFPKDAWYYYKAWWGGEPTTHIFPHWNHEGQEGQPIHVEAYSNAPKVELVLNGKSLGVKDNPPYEHAEWEVPYEKGTLEARGLDVDGKQISYEKQETTGAPASLRIVVDGADTTPGGNEMVEVDVLDAQNRIVPTADNQVSFTVKGAAKIVGVGNGDPSSHESDKLPVRHAFNGRCMVILQTSVKAGSLEVTASAAGLKSASWTLKTK